MIVLTQMITTIITRLFVMVSHMIVLLTEHKNGLLKMSVIQHTEMEHLFHKLQAKQNGQTSPLVLGVTMITTLPKKCCIIGMRSLEFTIQTLTHQIKNLQNLNSSTKKFIKN